MKTEKQLWHLIQIAGWTKDQDYNRIKDKFLKLSKNTHLQLTNFIYGKHTELYEKFKSDWLGKPGIQVSDDGYSDLLAEVIGRGEKFFNEITVKKLQEMAKTNDYNESFLYTTHER